MRLNRFDDFILESYLMSLNESVIEYSDKFQDLLKIIDSPISKELLSVYKEDREVKSNWFDVGKDAEHLSFMVDAKAQKIAAETKRVRVTYPSIMMGYYYNDVLGELGFNRSNLYMPQVGDAGTVKKEMVRKLEKIYLVYFDEEGTKQAVIKADFTEPDTSIFWEKNRQEIRVGRGVRALLTTLNLKFTDAQIEDFVNKYKAAYDIVKDAFAQFELVRGNKIATYYYYDNYLEPHRGDLGNSCMKEKPSWYFGIYTQNSSVCSLLILKSVVDPTKIVGRALVWNLSEPDIIFMDRVYCNKPSQVELFREYAKSKGWHYKRANDNSASTAVTTPTGEYKNFDSFKVRLKNLDYTAYPYVDTIKYFIQDKYECYLTTEEESDSKMLESTDGVWVGEDCDYCGGSGRQGCEECDATGQVKCETCKGSGQVDCEECNGEGEVDGETCTNCDGNKEVDCEDCEGGELDCSECNGDGQLPCEHC